MIVESSWKANEVGKYDNRSNPTRKQKAIRNKKNRSASSNLRECLLVSSGWIHRHQGEATWKRMPELRRGAF